MSTARRALLACAVLAVAHGCGDDEDGVSPAMARGGGVSDPATPPTPAMLFPLTPGDRWRIETDDGVTVQNQGVTGVERSGVAVIHGTGHAIGERYRSAEDAIWLVDGDGTALFPILRAPVRRGAELPYELTDQGVAVPCRAIVRTAGVTESVAGRVLDGCVDIRRTCTYPEGQPFERATTRTTDELYCPGVGRIRETATFEPAPRAALVPARRTERLVGWRVDGAPPMPEPVMFGCESFILLPSDVQAACGASVAPDDPASGRDADERCTYRYRAPAGAIVIEARRQERPVEAAAIDAAISPGGVGAALRTEEGVRIASGEEMRLGLAHGRLLVTLVADADACPEESALRLAPLLRSLIAR